MTQKIALITGASRGLGGAMAEELTARGWHVVAVARTVGALEELDDRIKARRQPGGGEATLAPMDVTNDDAMRHLCLSIHQRWGGLGLWIHAAIHAAPLTPAPMVDDKDWAKSLATNVEATRRLIAYVAPLLGQRTEAAAVFFDDPGAQGSFFASYGATKAAQMALARSWQAESLRTGPRVHVLTPAPMATATRARFYPGEDRAALATPQHEAERLAAMILAQVPAAS